MASTIERITVKLPTGFDPAKHERALMKIITDRYGAGFDLDSIDPTLGTAHASRQVAITEVTHNASADSFEVRLARGTKPSDGERVEAKLIDQNPGYFMTGFEPFLGKATLTRMSDDEARCRGAVAVAMGVKPWDVGVSQRPDGGFDLRLPRTYVGSKHDNKLDEVATTVVGRDGWYVQVNAQRLTASLIPADPPTFPPAIPFPVKRLGKGDVMSTPFGWILPKPGETKSEEAVIDWRASGSALVSGLAGGGKAQPLDAPIPVPVSERFPTGWATMGDLDLGDRIYSRDGSITTVTYLSPIQEREVFALTVSDGQVIEADGEHLWLASDYASRLAVDTTKSAAKRERADAEAQAEYDLLVDVARAHAGQAGTVADIARLVARHASTIGTFISQTAIPAAGQRGQAHLYPVAEVVRAWAEHRRSLAERRQSSRAPEFKVVTTHEIADSLHYKGTDRLNWSIPVAAAVDGPTADLPLDPYVFGVWLGDGTRRTGAITSADDFVVAQVKAAGFPLRRVEDQPGNAAKVYHFDDLWAALRLTGAAGTKAYPVGKHIPADYLRASADQRLALLQGLLDADGSVRTDGAVELTLADERLIRDALELVRSLGIKASLTSGPATMTTTADDGTVTRLDCGTRWRIKFTTTSPVFRLPRKAERLPASTRPTRNRLYVTDIRSVGVKPVRCIAVENTEHTYLTAGFVPTHNTVAITAIMADRIANGAYLAVIDTADKSVDFLSFKDMCGVTSVDGKFIPGWGCETLGAAVAVLAMLCEEGKRRAKILAELRINNWLDLPKDKAFKPIFIIADEYEALVAKVPEPKALPKDHPIRVEAIEENMAHDLIGHYMNRIVKEFRFVGLNPLISTQVSNASTGLPPSLKGKMGHFVLCGTTPSEAARKQSFPDASGVPTVPANVASGGAVARGAGSAKIEGNGAFIFKSYFASVADYRKALIDLGVPTYDDRKVVPTQAQIDKYLPSLDDEDGGREAEKAVRGGGRGGDVAPSGKPAAQVAAEMGDTDGMALHDGSLGSGFERANAIRHMAGRNAGKVVGKAKREAAEEAGWAAQSGEVTVRHAEPRDTDGDDW